MTCSPLARLIQPRPLDNVGAMEIPYQMIAILQSPKALNEHGQ